MSVFTYCFVLLLAILAYTTAENGANENKIQFPVNHDNGTVMEGQVVSNATAAVDSHKKSTVPEPATKTKPVKTTTTEKPVKTTTKKPVKTTTEKPVKTTTEKPVKTTTKKPDNTTTPVPPKTTTKKPDNTTTKAPDTTVAPPSPDKPPKTPGVNNFEVRDPKNNNSLCFKTNMALELKLSYYNTQNSTVAASINVPELSENMTIFMKPKCKTEKHVDLQMEWEWNNKTWSISFGWSRDNASYNLTSITANIPQDDYILPNSTFGKTWTIKNNTLDLFSTHLNKSYECDAEKKFVITKNFTLDVRHYKVQAFAFNSNTTFSTDRIVCSDDTHAATIVPIVVGCVLAGLIVIVVVAYIVASRYKKYHGYETL